jgi:sideroflexin-5
VAAKRAVRETAFTRFFLPGPALFFPALANFAIHRAGLWPRNLAASKVLETGLCALSLSVALPMSVALFQQKSMAHCESLEEEFREVRDEEGQIIKVMFFNKGL